MFGWLRPIFALLARFGPWVMLAAILFLAGILLTLVGTIFGFSLDDVDRWFDAHGSWFGAIGDILFRLACGLVLLICVLGVASPFIDRKNPERPGLGCVFLALLVGYFAWIGMTTRS
jgi:hypothetical protein